VYCWWVWQYWGQDTSGLLFCQTPSPGVPVLLSRLQRRTVPKESLVWRTSVTLVTSLTQLSSVRRPETDSWSSIIMNNKDCREYTSRRRIYRRIIEENGENMSGKQIMNVMMRNKNEVLTNNN